MDAAGDLHTVGVATADHVLPLRNGGMSRYRNLVAACWNCIMKRGEEGR
jgi:5-methylcytosine-specific restriction endonuclease McrA